MLHQDEVPPYPMPGGDPDQAAVEVPRPVRALVDPGQTAVERERRRTAEARALAAEGALAVAAGALAAAEGALASVEARLSSVEGRVRGGVRSAKVLRAVGAGVAPTEGIRL